MPYPLIANIHQNCHFLQEYMFLQNLELSFYLLFACYESFLVTFGVFILMKRLQLLKEMYYS